MRFFCRPDSALHWLNLTGTEFEMTLSLQVDLVLSDAATSLISVKSFCVQWHSDVAKMRTAPEKCNIYAKFCKECDPWLLILAIVYAPEKRWHKTDKHFKT